MDPDPHGSGTFAWIRKSENSMLDPEQIIPDPQHWLKDYFLYELETLGDGSGSRRKKTEAGQKRTGSETLPTTYRYEQNRGRTEPES